MRMIKKLILLILALLFSTCEREVSVSPIDVPPPTGKVYLTTNPQGAKIFLNGKYRNRQTPDSLTWLAGEYLLTLRKDYYTDFSTIIKINTGQKINIDIDYTKDPQIYGSIICNSSPSDAEIYIDSKNTGKKTPAIINKILPGKYNFELRKNNHKNHLSFVEVYSSQKTQVFNTLIDSTIWKEFYTTNSLLPENNLVAIGSNNEAVWVGTGSKGVVKITSNNWTRFHEDNSPVRNNNITNIFVDSEDRVWVGTLRQLCYLKGNGGEFYNSQQNGIVGFNVFNIFKAENDVYICTETALNILDFSRGNSKAYVGNLLPNIKEKPYSCGIYSKKGEIWLGYKNNGIDKFNSNSLIDSDVKNYTSKNSALAGNDIICFTENRTNGIIWAAVRGDVNHYDAVCYFDGNQWKTISLSLTKLNSIFCDSRGILWISTDSGIILMKDFKVEKTFDSTTTGLNLTGVNQVCEDKYGNIWIASANGLFKYIYK